MSPVTPGQKFFFGTICAAAFTATTVIVSILHINLFAFNEIADLPWFAGFIVSSIILTAMTRHVLQAR